MTRILIFLFIISVTTSCSKDYRNGGIQELNKNVAAGDTQSPLPQPGCYAYTNDRDTLMIQISESMELVKGRYLTRYNGKDRNIGTIKGEMHNDTLRATFRFLSEGVVSERTVNFKVLDEEIFEIFQTSKADSRMAALLMKRGACITDKNYCYLAEDIWWSGSDSRCVVPSVGGMILNDLTNGEDPGYLMFNDNQAEVFLPDYPQSIILERTGDEGAHYWTSGSFKLIQWRGYVLQQNGKAIYGGGE